MESKKTQSWISSRWKITQKSWEKGIYLFSKINLIFGKKIVCGLVTAYLVTSRIVEYSNVSHLNGKTKKTTKRYMTLTVQLPVGFRIFPIFPKIEKYNKVKVLF